MPTKNEIERAEKLLPDGKPRYVRCYDNGGKTADAYTVVFTGNYTKWTHGEHWVLGMSGNPFYPTGICMLNSYRYLIDYPTYSHLGKKIGFKKLPEDCQKAVLQDYVYLWNIKQHPLYRED